MKKVIAIIILLWNIAHAQTVPYQPINPRDSGVNFNKVDPKLVLHVPELTDATLLHTSNPNAQIRIFGGDLWFYSRITGLWTKVTGISSSTNLNTSYDFTVLDSLDQPAGTEIIGTTLLVSTSPTGVFAGHANSIAVLDIDGVTWLFTDPSSGQTLMNVATDFISQWTTVQWLKVGKAAIHQGLDDYATAIKIGTIQNQDVTFWTNNIARMTISNTGGFTFGSLLGTGDGLMGLNSGGTAFRTTIGTGLDLTGGVLSATSSDLTGFDIDDLPPIFTSTVDITNPSSPFIHYNLSTAPAYSYLGNPTGSDAIPTYNVPVYGRLGDVALSSITDGQLVHWDAGLGKWTNFTPTYLSAVPNLQQVTDVGNITNNGIGIFSGGTGNLTVANLAFTNAIQLSQGTTTGKIIFQRGGSVHQLQAENLSSGANKTLQLPNISATLVASVNGVFANTAGNVTIPAGLSSTLTNTHLFVGNASNVATDVAASGDLTLANTGAFTLATVNANVGTFGDNLHVPQVTYDAKGRATSITSVAINRDRFGKLGEDVSDAAGREFNNVGFDWSIISNNIYLEARGGQHQIRNTTALPWLVFKNDAGETSAPASGALISGSWGGGGIKIYSNSSGGPNRLSLGVIDNSNVFTSFIDMNAYGSGGVQFNRRLQPLFSNSSANIAMDGTTAHTYTIINCTGSMTSVTMISTTVAQIANGSMYWIRNSTTGTVTINPAAASGQTFDGAATYSLAPGDAVLLASNNTNSRWNVLSSHKAASGITTETDPLGWRLLGNAGTSSSTNFIGTTDNVAVMFRQNNTISGTIGTIGTSNTSFGYQGQAFISSGIANTSMGTNSQRDVSTGSANTSFGALALQNNTTGNFNTAVGQQSLTASTGSNNTAIGRNTLILLTTGSDNTALGYNAAGTATNLSNTIAIGSGSAPTVSNQLAFPDAVTKMYFKNLEASTGATSMVGIDASGNWKAYPVPSGGGGETNTASNLGGGLANYSTKVGVDLQFNSFDANNFDLASNLLSLDYTNSQSADATHKGFLTAADWVIFNAKSNFSGAFSALTGIPTTVAGYGITDVYDKTASDARYFQISNNLSEGTTATMRTNLGLGTSATHPSGDYLLAANNLSDVTASTARTNLGLGSAALNSVGDFWHLNPTTVKTSNYSAAAFEFVPVNTSGGAVTITLPTAPADKTLVGGNIVTAGNTLTFSAGGTDVINRPAALTITLTAVAQSAILQYNAASGVWYVMAGQLLASSVYTGITGDVTINTSGVSDITAGSIVNADIANSTIDLTAKVAGVLPYANGGTNASTLSGAKTNLGVGYAMVASFSNNFSPADATTYYFAFATNGAPNTNQANNGHMYFPTAGTITKVDIVYRTDGTLGTTENSTFSIRLNNTTDNTISSVVQLNSTASQEIHLTGLNIPVGADFADYIDIKWVTPTWAINPTNPRIAITMWVQQ